MLPGKVLLISKKTSPFNRDNAGKMIADPANLPQGYPGNFSIPYSPGLPILKQFP